MAAQAPFVVNHQNKPAKSWFYTLNNYSEAEWTQLKDLECTYHVLGKEIGQSGTPHVQGTVTFATAKRFSALTTLNSRIHWEKVKDLESARNYCMKDKDYVIVDNRKQGNRSDLQSAVSVLMEDGITALVKQHPVEYLKFHSGFHKLHYTSLLGKRDLPDKTVHWLWGSTGSGKTYAVHHVTDDLWTSHPGQGVNWFDGYIGQKDVLFDDFRSDNIKFADFLRILDNYPLQLSIKGGMTHWTPHNIFITSPKKPSACYGFIDEDVEQLMRRISHVWHFPEDKNDFYDYFAPPSQEVPSYVDGHDNTEVIELSD